jgi:hypothetical protein
MAGDRSAWSGRCLPTGAFLPIENITAARVGTALFSELCELVLVGSPRERSVPAYVARLPASRGLLAAYADLGYARAQRRDGRCLYSVSGLRHALAQLLGRQAT